MSFILAWLSNTMYSIEKVAASATTFLQNIIILKTFLT